MEAISKTWHRRPNETDKAYRAFTLYLNQPPPRSLLYVRNAGYSPVSVQKWKNENEWIPRSIDYDNSRVDTIMAQDVSLVSLYQQKVTEAGLEDMQILRGMWMKAAQILNEEVQNRDTELGDDKITAAQLLTNIGALARARLDIDKLSRLSARMPDTHKPLIVAEDVDTFPDDIVELSFNGVRSIPSGTEEVVIEYGDEESDSEEETITE